MRTCPIRYIEACMKPDLPSYTLVIHKDEFEYYTWIKVPNIISKRFELFELHEMTEPPKEVNIRNCCTRIPDHPWYRILTSQLCMCPGLHVYKMHMVDRWTNDVTSIFFAYHVQDDDPKKPYIYMDPSERCACCSKAGEKK